jgi:hemerythrin-like domain-containing protein
MKTNITKNPPREGTLSRRREFLKKGVILGAVTSVAGLSFISSCKNESDEGISPAEDLMREHGVLNRIMLIYDSCRLHLINAEQFSRDALGNAAGIIKTFIENYHEKLEEDFLFPRFVNANELTDLVYILRIQHLTGRKITEQVIQLSETKSTFSTEDSQRLISLLNSFNVMYRPHEAREDTILFPALRKIISENEYFALGEDFEDREHELFGEDGFEAIVEKVAVIEKQIGIYDLSRFTPDLI